MILKVFSVYDSKVEAFLKPFYMRNVNEAIRGFTEVCNDSKTEFYKYPSDYTLFELGTWDDSSSKFSLHQTPLSLGLAIEFRTTTALAAQVSLEK